MLQLRLPLLGASQLRAPSMGRISAQRQPCVSLCDLQQHMLPIIVRAANNTLHQLPPGWQRPHRMPANILPEQASTQGTAKTQGSHQRGTQTTPNLSQCHQQLMAQSCHLSTNGCCYLAQRCPADPFSCHHLLVPVHAASSSPHALIRAGSPLHPPAGGCSKDFGCRGAGWGHSWKQYPPALPKRAKVCGQDKGESSLGFICKRYETTSFGNDVVCNAGYLCS